MTQDVDLYKIKLCIPQYSVTGEIVEYYYKSFGNILDDQNDEELLKLKDWFTDQCLEYVDVKVGVNICGDKELTAENIEKMFRLFTRLNIEPKGIVYDTGEIF